jgi:hypothetical protein
MTPQAISRQRPGVSAPAHPDDAAESVGTGDDGSAGGGQERTHGGPPWLSFGLLQAQLDHTRGQSWNYAYRRIARAGLSTELFERYHRLG